LPVGAAAGLLAVVIGVGVAGSGGGDAGSAPPAASAPGVPVVPVIPVASTAAPTTIDHDPVAAVPTTAPVDKVPLAATVHPGAYGSDVEMVQKRLVELGFDPGPIDSAYGTMSQQAVWAFDKLVMGTPRDQVTGSVTPEMWSRMQDPIRIVPRQPTGGLGDHVEIYLPEQVMVVFHADQPALVTHISTGKLNPDGSWYEYRETREIDTDINGDPIDPPRVEHIVGWAKTPPGVFTAYRYIEGTRNGPLGDMWNPIYINQGIAIHGALTVPRQPASHGCIRVPMHISEYLWGVIEKGDKVLIWGHDGREPQDYSARERQMLWDQLDPTVSTTTSTTSTTVAPTAPPTTPAPAATNPATTTAPATTIATTTTTSAPPTTTIAPPPTTAPATTTLPAEPPPPTILGG
jgi:hypothetical protein